MLSTPIFLPSLFRGTHRTQWQHDALQHTTPRCLACLFEIPSPMILRRSSNRLSHVYRAEASRRPPSPSSPHDDNAFPSSNSPKASKDCRSGGRFDDVALSSRIDSALRVHRAKPPVYDGDNRVTYPFTETPWGCESTLCIRPTYRRRAQNKNKEALRFPSPLSVTLSCVL